MAWTKAMENEQVLRNDGEDITILIEKVGPNDGDDDGYNKMEKDCWRSQFIKGGCTPHG